MAIDDMAIDDMAIDDMAIDDPAILVFSLFEFGICPTFIANIWLFDYPTMQCRSVQV
jgi:hypothetical protein